MAGAAKGAAARTDRHALRCAGHQRRVEGAGDLERDDARRAGLSVAASPAASTASFVPPMLTLPGAFSLQTAVPCSAQIASTCARLQAEHRGHGAGVGVAGLLHQPSALVDEADAVLEADRARAAISAAYSPSEWPARKAGRAVTVPASIAATSAAMLCVTSAGCVLTVRVSSSSGPSKQSVESAKPSASSAASKTARAAGISLVEVPAHADVLRALTGEEPGLVGGGGQLWDGGGGHKSSGSGRAGRRRSATVVCGRARRARPPQSVCRGQYGVGRRAALLR